MQSSYDSNIFPIWNVIDVSIAIDTYAILLKINAKPETICYPFLSFHWFIVSITEYDVQSDCIQFIVLICFILTSNFRDINFIDLCIYICTLLVPVV